MGLENSSPNQLKAKFDMSESENFEFSGKSQVLSKLLQPNSLEVLLHCQAGLGHAKKLFSEECEQIIRK